MIKALGLKKSRAFLTLPLQGTLKVYFNIFFIFAATAATFVQQAVHQLIKW